MSVRKTWTDKESWLDYAVSVVADGMSQGEEVHAFAAAELSALRELRDAVGVFMACNEPLSERYHDAKVKVRKAYEKAKEVGDGK